MTVAVLLGHDSISKNKIVSKHNLTLICYQHVHREQTADFGLVCLNAQSCRNETDAIWDLIEELNIDRSCLTETRLREEGDEPLMPSMKPPGYDLIIMSSFTSVRRNYCL